VFRPTGIDQVETARRLEGGKVLRNVALLNLADAPQQLVDRSQQVTLVSRRINVGRYFEGGQVHGVGGRIKRHLGSGIQASDAKAMIDMPGITQVRTKLEG